MDNIPLLPTETATTVAKRDQHPKVNDLTIERVAAAIKKGLPRYRAAVLAGITQRHFTRLCNQGEEAIAQKKGPDECVEVRFVLALERAEAEHQDTCLDQIDAEFQAGRWPSAPMTVMERRYPEEWGKRSRLDIKGQHEVNVHTWVSLLDEPEGQGIDVEATEVP